MRTKISISLMIESIVFALASFVRSFKCFAIALLHGVILPPLPVFWDRLNKLNWLALCPQDGVVDQNGFSADFPMFVRLLSVAGYSEKHYKLLGEFLCYGNRSGKKPSRPGWLSTQD